MYLYVTSSPHWLLCPHHWAQQSKENYPAEHGAGWSNFDNGCESVWYQCQNKRNIDWDPKTNIAITPSDPGFKKFQIYAATVDAETIMNIKMSTCRHCISSHQIKNKRHHHFSHLGTMTRRIILPFFRTKFGRQRWRATLIPFSIFKIFSIWLTRMLSLRTAALLALLAETPVFFVRLWNVLGRYYYKQTVRLSCS